MRLIGTLIIFIILQLSASQLHAQSHKEDVVYLENGSVYRGTLLENYRDSTIAIQIIGGSIIVIPEKEIVSITREEAYDPFNIIYSPRDTGYTFFASIGLLLGSDDWGYESGVFVDMINGYHFNEQFQGGIGTLLEASGDFYLSVYLDGRYNLKSGKNSPFVYGDFGIYTPLINKENGDIEDIDPGVTTGLGLGLRSNSKSSQTGFIISVGYKMSMYSITENDRWSNNLTTYEYTLHRFILKIGLVF